MHGPKILAMACSAGEKREELNALDMTAYLHAHIVLILFLPIKLSELYFRGIIYFSESFSLKSRACSAMGKEVQMLSDPAKHTDTPFWIIQQYLL